MFEVRFPHGSGTLPAIRVYFLQPIEFRTQLADLLIALLRTYSRVKSEAIAGLGAAGGETTTDGSGRSTTRDSGIAKTGGSGTATTAGDVEVAIGERLWQAVRNKRVKIIWAVKHFAHI